MAESIKLKAILHLVLLYGWSYLSEMRPASLLKATMADGPQSPLLDRTRGVKVPCSTLRTRCSICSPLLSFMPSVASIGGGCTIRRCIGVEDSDIKEG